MFVPNAASRALSSRLAVAALVVALSLLVPTAISAARPPNTPPGDVNVQLLAINDFHGNLQPPAGSSGRVGSTLAGGVEYLATHIKALEATNPDRTLEVAAGDLIGASPLLSAAFHDEPTIEAMNALGLDISAVGNHEFDEGVDELLRMQNGGCHPVDGCQDGDGFAGADFQFLAANVVVQEQRQADLPGLQDPQPRRRQDRLHRADPQGHAEHRHAERDRRRSNFLDEADTINAATAALKAKGVHTIVVLHPRGRRAVRRACPRHHQHLHRDVRRDRRRSSANLDPEVDMVISGHTHNAYNCLLPNSGGVSIPVSSASSFGRLVTDIDMTINRASDQPTSISVDNQIVTRDVALDPAETTLITKYNTAIAPDRQRGRRLDHGRHHPSEQRRRRVGARRRHRRRPARRHARTRRRRSRS